MKAAKDSSARPAGVLRKAFLIPAALIGVLIMLPTGEASAQSGINVYMNYARILKLDREVAKVIIGNPEIADVAVSDAETIVVTGRSFGSTNLVILDDMGQALVDERVIVSRDRADTLRVFRNTNATTLTCSPVCEDPDAGATGSIE